jgi:hypothetical protein
LFDPFFRDGPVDLAGSAEEFARVARQRWGRSDSPGERLERLAWYDRNLDPRTLDARLLDLLLKATA